MNEALVANDTGDLYDFRLDGGISAQQYEGLTTATRRNVSRRQIYTA